MTVIPYGTEKLKLDLANRRHLTELNLIGPPPIKNLRVELIRLLESSPVRLNSNNTIALACDDNPASIEVLKSLLNILSYTEPESIRIFFIAKNGIPSNLLDIEIKHPTFYHDPQESTTQMIGYTLHDTPVEINSQFLDAEIKVVIGSILPDAFWSVTGGLTHVIPGLTSHKTNLLNTRLAMSQRPVPMNPGSKRLLDAKDAADLTNVDMFLIVQTHIQNQIAGISVAYSADELLTFYANMSRLFSKNVNRYYDLVIVGAGGFPLDSTLFDAMPALYSAFSATRKNGIIVLISKCNFGLGPTEFTSLMQDLDRLESTQVPCQIGSERIRFLLEILKYHRLLIYSEGLNKELSSTHPKIETFTNLKTCMDTAHSYMTSASRSLIIQDGQRIIPKIVSN